MMRDTARGSTGRRHRNGGHGKGTREWGAHEGDTGRGCLAGAVLTHSPLIAATRVRYLASACEMGMWSPRQTGGFHPGTPVSSHTKTIRTQTSVPTSMINISCITCFVIVVK